MIERLQRDAILACVLMTLAAVVVWPGAWRVAGGVVGGGALIGLSFWAIKGGVEGLGQGRGGGRALVKFFTRHAILAFAAYGMMVRLRLDPIAMLAGVSSFGLAAAVEAGRALRRRDGGR